MNRTFLSAIVGLTMFFASGGKAHACRRCGYSVCRYQYATQYHTTTPYNYTYNYPDNSFRVTYNINFPQYPTPGSTIFEQSRYQSQIYQNQAAILQPEQFINAASRHLELSHSTLQQGFSDFNQTASLLFQGQQNVLELQTRADIAREIMREFPRLPQPGQTAQYTISRSASGKITVDPPRTNGQANGQYGNGGNAFADRMAATIQQACIRCHSPGGERSETDLRDLSKLTREQYESILFRVLTDDPEKIMPPPRTNIVLAAEQKVDFTKLCLSALSSATKSPPAKLPVPASNDVPPPIPQQPLPQQPPQLPLPSPPPRDPKPKEPKEEPKDKPKDEPKDDPDGRPKSILKEVDQ